MLFTTTPRLLPALRAPHSRAGAVCESSAAPGRSTRACSERSFRKAVACIGAPLGSDGAAAQLGLGLRVGRAALAAVPAATRSAAVRQSRASHRPRAQYVHTAHTQRTHAAHTHSAHTQRTHIYARTHARMHARTHAPPAGVVDLAAVRARPIARLRIRSRRAHLRTAQNIAQHPPPTGVAPHRIHNCRQCRPGPARWCRCFERKEYSGYSCALGRTSGTRVRVFTS